MKKQTILNAKVEIAFSENSDGNMRYFEGEDEDEATVIKNQQQLARQLGLTGDKTARVRTIYGDRKNFTEYFEITDQNISKYNIDNPEKDILVSDGMVTKSSNVGILLPLADCLGIVVFDETHNVLGLLHAGRQNLEQLGPRKFVEFFVEKYKSNPSELEVYFSPHALNYQVYKFNKSLSETAKEQLLVAGILPENITDARIDTVNNVDLPSYSNGDKTKRFALLAKLNNQLDDI